MQDAFLRFVHNPCQRCYLEVRQQVLADAGFRPFADELAEAEDLLLADLPEEAAQSLLQAMPILLLSPKAHWLLSRIAQASQMDDAQEAAQMEQALAELCIEGLLSTGNGEQETPFLLTLFTDEQDILDALRKRSVTQERVLRGGRWRHQVLCDDGSQLWFDVHDLYYREAEAGLTSAASAERLTRK